MPGYWRRAADLPTTRANGGGVWHQGYAYCLGGEGLGGGLRKTNFRFDPVTNAWAFKADLPAEGYFVAVSNGSHIFAANTVLGKLYRYDATADTWTVMADLPAASMSGRMMGLDGAGRIWLFGGSSATIHRYDIASNLWSSPGSMGGWFNNITEGGAAVLAGDGQFYFMAYYGSSRLLALNLSTYAITTVRYPSQSTPTGYIPDAGTAHALLGRDGNNKPLILPHATSGTNYYETDRYEVSPDAWTLDVIGTAPTGTPVLATALANGPQGELVLMGGDDNIGGGFYSAVVYQFVINLPPNAPILTSLATGTVIDRNNVNRASHNFSDPDPGDSQSAFDLSYRLVGAPTWTSLNFGTPNQFYDFPAGSLPAGDYERQVRTYDSQGVQGPWSPSGFFTAADAPAGPSITYPTNGQMVESSETVTWSTSTQAAYQVRRVADSAGLPDVGVVYFDTGEVVSALTRSLDLNFETNDRTEHVQVRVKNDGLWSGWVSISVDVSYTPPPAPTFIIYADPSTASLAVSVTNPAPGVDQPAAAYNDVFIDDGDGEERRAGMLSTNATWRYWTPRSGRDYATAVRVVAVASNGTTTSSA